MSHPYYLQARNLADVPLDALVALRLARLWEPPGHARRPSERVATALQDPEPDGLLCHRVQAEVGVAGVLEPVPPELVIATRVWAQGLMDDASLARAWEAEVRRRTGEAPYALGDPLAQLPYKATAALEIPALLEAARLRREGRPVPEALAATPIARAGSPCFGKGPVEVIIVGDPTDRALPAALRAAHDALGPLASRVRWAWIHAPPSETPENVVLGLRRQHVLCGAAGIDLPGLALLLEFQGVPHVPLQREYPDRAAIVLDALRALDACGVPRGRRPALIVGDRLHLGIPGSAFAGDVEARCSLLPGEQGR